MTDRFLTIVIRNPTKDEARELVNHPKLSAASWSHAIDERDEYRYRCDTWRSVHSSPQSSRDAV